MQLNIVDLSLFLIVSHVSKNLVWLLGLRVWFVNLILAYIIYMCIDSMYLKIWMGDAPTYSQFDCTLIILIFELNLFYLKKKNQ